MNLWDFHSILYENFRHRYPFKLILEQENKNVLQFIHSLTNAPSVILDIGTGHANGLGILNECTFTTNSGERPGQASCLSLTKPLLIGIDRSDKMLHHAAKKFDIEIIKCDARHLSFKKNSIFLIMAIGLIEYISNLKYFFKEMSRVLNKEGRIILTFSPPNLFFYLRFFLGKKLFRRSISMFEGEIEAAGLIIEKKLTTLMQIQYLIKK